MTKQEFESFGFDTRVWKVGNGYVHYYFDVRIVGQEFEMHVCFCPDGKLHGSLDFSVPFGYKRTWEDDREKTSQRVCELKDEHDAWLLKNLGEPNAVDNIYNYPPFSMFPQFKDQPDYGYYSFPWGKVVSYCDPYGKYDKAGWAGAGIYVHYREA